MNIIVLKYYTTTVELQILTLIQQIYSNKSTILYYREKTFRAKVNKTQIWSANILLSYTNNILSSSQFIIVYGAAIYVKQAAQYDIKLF